jgi:hypothetical protein
MTHPITPPPELVQQWRKSGPADAAVNNAYERHIATQAARWGADHELAACCDAVYSYEGSPIYGGTAEWLRSMRRPKPPSLKEQALEAAQRFYAKGHGDCTDEEIKDDFDTIRRALEALDD